jgi:hypothetical protein
MMGSVAEAMKEKLPQVAGWVLAAKVSGAGSLVRIAGAAAPEGSR